LFLPGTRIPLLHSWLFSHSRDANSNTEPRFLLVQTRSVGSYPEGMNGARAEWAACCICHFQCQTGVDWDDAPADHLCDLVHFCDREGFDFREELDRARMHYQAEIIAANKWGPGCRRPLLPARAGPCGMREPRRGRPARLLRSRLPCSPTDTAATFRIGPPSPLTGRRSTGRTPYATAAPRT
jgi:hypothetical protein